MVANWKLYDPHWHVQNTRARLLTLRTFILLLRKCFRHPRFPLPSSCSRSVIFPISELSFAPLLPLPYDTSHNSTTTITSAAPQQLPERALHRNDVLLPVCGAQLLRNGPYSLVPIFNNSGTVFYLILWYHITGKTIVTDRMSATFVLVVSVRLMHYACEQI